MTSSQTINSVSSNLVGLFTTSLDRRLPPLLRCNLEPVSSIAIDETQAELVLNIQIETDFVAFEVQATPGKLLICGHWLETVSLEGSSCPRPFEHWIALPHLVYPETLCIKTRPHSPSVTIQLTKHLNPKQDED